ncbi:MAG: AAA family ATPase [Chloroflexi bacterium]|nr:AAA family ATPase [Chloroflexota bacterium]
MIIESVRVKNFRSILDETLPCDALTALVGRNGSGKSSFLSAIELFYDQAAKVGAEDFYGGDISNEIEIEVNFGGLSPAAKELFSPYVENDTLAVVRVFSMGEGRRSGTYHGARLRNPEFVAVRIAGNNTNIRAEYNRLRGTEKYAGLPSASSAAIAQAAMDQWESEHLDECSRIRDEGQFFGFTQVAHGYLGRFTKFIRVPAVRDAQEDAIEKRGSCVTEIMDLVVRSVLSNRQDLTDFRERTQAEYHKIVDPANLGELQSLQHGLSETLHFYAPDSQVHMDWTEMGDISIPLPQAQVKLTEDGYESAVERTGHGLQRHSSSRCCSTW